MQELARKPIRFLIAAAVLLAAAAISWLLWPADRPDANAEAVFRQPIVAPDYSDIVLPPNIAPLNFVVREEGRHFFVRLSGQTGESIEIASSSPSIAIPLRPWRRLLQANRGQTLQIDVFAQSAGKWRRYQTIVNRIADDEIDGHLVYRLIPPVHSKWREVTIQQRDLTGFDESPVLEGWPLDQTCVNCHTFPANRPGRMLIGMRGSSFGNATLLADEGQVKKLNKPFGYSAWHPSGQLVTYSSNKVRQFFHAAGPEVRDVVDLESSLSYYRVDANESQEVPGASNEQQMATYPTWSPDGRQLFYCRAPIVAKDRETVPPDRYEEIKYDLVRIDYDLESDRWGKPETILSTKETGLSILLPRVSPDGRFLLFCMCRYGCFPAYQPSSDLYMLDLAKRTYAKLPINSDLSESWHSWSSNSRWIAFSSKRLNGTFTRCFLSYVDGTGQAHKPFVLPQSDPELYDSLLKTFSVPELVVGPVPTSPGALMRAARSEPVAIQSPFEAGAEKETTEPYEQTAR